MKTIIYAQIVVDRKISERRLYGVKLALCEFIKDNALSFKNQLSTRSPIMWTVASYTKARKSRRGKAVKS
jgi:hypothetical protein